MDTMNEWTSSYSMNESKENEEMQRTEYHNYLKVLSSEMDPTEIRLIR